MGNLSRWGKAARNAVGILVLAGIMLGGIRANALEPSKTGEDPPGDYGDYGGSGDDSAQSSREYTIYNKVSEAPDVTEENCRSSSLTGEGGTVLFFPESEGGVLWGREQPDTDSVVLFHRISSAFDGLRSIPLISKEDSIAFRVREPSGEGLPRSAAVSLEGINGQREFVIQIVDMAERVEAGRKTAASQMQDRNTDASENNYVNYVEAWITLQKKRGATETSPGKKYPVTLEITLGATLAETRHLELKEGQWLLLEGLPQGALVTIESAESWRELDGNIACGTASADRAESGSGGKIEQKNPPQVVFCRRPYGEKMEGGFIVDGWVFIVIFTIFMSATLILGLELSEK